MEVSADCLDMLTKVLVAEPAQRLGMDDIKTHRWFVAGLPTGALDMNDFLLKGMDSQSTVGPPRPLLPFLACMALSSPLCLPLTMRPACDCCLIAPAFSCHAFRLEPALRLRGVRHVQCQRRVDAIVDQAQRMGTPGEGIWSCRLLVPLVQAKAGRGPPPSSNQHQPAPNGHAPLANGHTPSSNRQRSSSNGQLPSSNGHAPPPLNGLGPRDACVPSRS